MRETMRQLLILLFLMGSVFAAIGDPSKFGNSTTVTCYIGGTQGILNCTGQLIGKNLTLMTVCSSGQFLTLNTTTNLTYCASPPAYQNGSSNLTITQVFANFSATSPWLIYNGAGNYAWNDTMGNLTYLLNSVFTSENSSIWSAINARLLTSTFNAENASIWSAINARLLTSTFTAENASIWSSINSLITSNASTNDRITSVNSSVQGIFTDYANKSKSETIIGNWLFTPSSNVTFSSGRVLFYSPVFFYNDTTYSNTNAMRVNSSITVTDIGNVSVVNISDDGTGKGRIWSNGYAIFQQTVQASEFSGALNWTFLQNYPSGCSTGYAVQAVGDTLACVLMPTGNVTGSFSANQVPYATNSTNLASSPNLVFNETQLSINGTLRINTNNIIDMRTGSATSVDRLDILATQGNRGSSIQLIPSGTGTFSKFATANQNSSSNFGSIIIAADGNTGWINPQQVGTPTTNLTILRIGGVPPTAGGTNWSEIHLFSSNVSFRTNELRIADISNTFIGSFAAVLNNTTVPTASSTFGTSVRGLPNGHLFLDVFNNDINDAVMVRFNNSTAISIGAVFRPSSIDFYGNLRPDGADCGDGQTIYRITDGNWGCVTPIGGGAATKQVGYWHTDTILAGSGTFYYDFDNFLLGVGGEMASDPSATLDVRQQAIDGGAATITPAFKVTGGSHTQMASENHDAFFNFSRTLIMPGAFSNQRQFYITAPEYRDGDGLNIQSAATVAISGAPRLQSGVLEHSAALDIEGGSVTTGGTPTNAYGLRVAAPTGATNNYAAQFNGLLDATNGFKLQGALTLPANSVTDAFINSVNWTKVSNAPWITNNPYNLTINSSLSMPNTSGRIVLSGRLYADQVGTLTDDQMLRRGEYHRPMVNYTGANASLAITGMAFEPYFNATNITFPTVIGFDMQPRIQGNTTTYTNMRLIMPINSGTGNPNTTTTTNIEVRKPTLLGNITNVIFSLGGVASVSPSGNYSVYDDSGWNWYLKNSNLTVNGTINASSFLMPSVNSLSCSATIKGSLGYNFTSNRPCYCNSTSWLNMTGGTVC
jgi:hypothetical protein